MVMIIGGAYQGKRAFATKHYPVQYLDGDVCPLDAIFTTEGMYHFERYIARCDQHQRTTLADQLMEKNPSIVLVSTEIGCGVVPMDRKVRQYRETVGRICTTLAGFSHTVHRVQCGISHTIKQQERVDG